MLPPNPDFPEQQRRLREMSADEVRAELTPETRKRLTLQLAVFNVVVAGLSLYVIYQVVIMLADIFAG